jgi:hypothetical protein
MDRCPACKGFMVFETIISEPIWTRWTLCTRCGAYTSQSDDGVTQTGGTPPKARLAPPKPKVDNDDNDRIERPRLDELHGLQEVQPKRVGSTIGRHQL